MGIVNCTELFDGREGTPFKGDADRDYVRKFLVQVDSNLDNQRSIFAELINEDPLFTIWEDFPLPYNFYQNFDGSNFDEQSLFVGASVLPKEQGDWQFWIATCSYSTKMPPGGPWYEQCEQDNLGKPEMQRYVPRWESENVTYAGPFDLLGMPFTNSAGVPYKPSITMDMTRQILSFTSRELDFGQEMIDRWANKTCRTEFLGRPKGCALCLPPVGEEDYFGAIRTHKVTWKIKLGFKYPGKETQTGGEPILDGGGNPVLDENGDPTFTPIVIDSQPIEIRTKMAESGIPNVNNPEAEELDFEHFDFDYVLDVGTPLAGAGPFPNRPKAPRMDHHNQQEELLDGLGARLDRESEDPVYIKFLVKGYAELNDLLKYPDGSPFVP